MVVRDEDPGFRRAPRRRASCAVTLRRRQTCVVRLRGLGAASERDAGRGTVARGSRATTRVPLPFAASTMNVPPSSSARSRIDSRPTPGTGTLGSPRPSSTTSSRSVPSPVASNRTRQRGRGGVAHRVRERFEGNPVCRNFDRGGQLGEWLRPRFDADRRRPGRPTCREAHGLLAHRFDEPELIERRWPQPVDEAAHIGQRNADVATELVQQLTGAFGIRPERRGRGLGAQADRGERRPEAVMQVSPESTAFLLAGDDEPLARPREIVPQPDRADRGARLPSEVLEQPQLVATEAGLTGTHTQHEPSDPLRTMEEGLIHAGAAELAAFGHDRSVPSTSTSASATNGTRSASATVSTMAGNARSGSAAHSSTSPSRCIARHGSSRSPYISRFTVRCSTSRKRQRDERGRARSPAARPRSRARSRRAIRAPRRRSRSSPGSRA